MPTKSIIGGYNWKRLCVDTIRSERRTIDSLTKLMQVANTPETFKLIAAEIQAALDRIESLQDLKVYECPAYHDAYDELLKDVHSAQSMQEND